VSRVFLSHSSRDSRQAIAVRAWLVEQEPGLADEIYLDLDPQTGIRPGARWKQALQQANARCEAVICLLSARWEASPECQTEFRYAETLNKAILVARLEPVPDTNITSEWHPTTRSDVQRAAKYLDARQYTTPISRALATTTTDTIRRAVATRSSSHLLARSSSSSSNLTARGVVPTMPADRPPHRGKQPRSASMVSRSRTA
jgi:hypothetical protein